MSYGTEFSIYVADRLKVNGLKSLGGINRTLLAEWADDFQKRWIAKEKAIAAKASDEDWIKSLEESVANKGINVRFEIREAEKWTKKHSRRFSRRFVENWLSKADRNIDTKATETREPEVRRINGPTALIEPAGWDEAVKGTYPLNILRGREWATLGDYYQSEIVKFCAKLK